MRKTWEIAKDEFKGEARKFLHEFGIVGRIVQRRFLPHGGAAGSIRAEPGTAAARINSEVDQASKIVDHHTEKIVEEAQRIVVALRKLEMGKRGGGREGYIGGGLQDAKKGEEGGGLDLMSLFRLGSSGLGDALLTVFAPLIPLAALGAVAIGASPGFRGRAARTGVDAEGRDAKTGKRLSPAEIARRTKEDQLRAYNPKDDADRPAMHWRHDRRARQKALKEEFEKLDQQAPAEQPSAEEKTEKKSEDRPAVENAFKVDTRKYTARKIRFKARQFKWKGFGAGVGGEAAGGSGESSVPRDRTPNEVVRDRFPESTPNEVVKNRFPALNEKGQIEPTPNEAVRNRFPRTPNEAVRDRFPAPPPTPNDVVRDRFPRQEATRKSAPSTTADDFKPGKGDLYRKAGSTKPDIIDDTRYSQGQINVGTLDKSKPIGFVIHHTGGEERSAQQVYNTFHQRRFPAQFVIDKQGNIHQYLPTGASGAHVLPSAGFAQKGAPQGWSNRNTIGVEVVGEGDKTWTPAQRDAVKKLGAYLHEQYGVDPKNVFGHSELNPGHRENEGEGLAGQIRSEGFPRLTPQQSQEPAVAKTQSPPTVPAPQTPPAAAMPAPPVAREPQTSSVAPQPVPSASIAPQPPLPPAAAAPPPPPPPPPPAPEPSPNEPRPARQEDTTTPRPAKTSFRMNQGAGVSDDDYEQPTGKFAKFFGVSHSNDTGVA